MFKRTIYTILFFVYCFFMLWLAAKPAHAQSFFKSVHLVETPTTQATAGGTTTLTLASQTVQRFTGTQNQTVVLPNATTLSVGMYFLIANDSTGVLTVNDASSGLIATVLASNSVSLRLITNGAAAGVWTVENNYTAVPASGISGIVPLANGGTALSNVASQGGLAYGTSSGISLTAAGVSGQAVISQGTASPSFYNPTPGGVLFAGASGAISESASSFSWDSSTSRLQVGGGQNTLTIHGTTSGSNLTVSSQGGSNIYEVGIHRHNASTNPGIYLARSRGSEASPSIVQNGDILGVMDGLGFDGTDFEIGAQIDYVVDGTPGSNDMPGAILFKTTPDGSFTPATAATISQDKTLTLYGALDTALTTSGVVLTGSSGILSSRAQLDLLNGGTNANITASHGGIAYSTANAISLGPVAAAGTVLLGNGAGAYSKTAVSTSGQYLRGQGSADPVWADVSINQGSRQTAITISAGQAITPIANSDTAIFISGSGGAVTVTATTPITTTGMVIGQKLTLCGTSDTNTVTYSSGNNLKLAMSPITLRKDGCLQLMYAGTDGTNAAWIDMSNTAQFRATVIPGVIDSGAGSYHTLTWSSADIDNVSGFNGTDQYTVKIPGVYSICGFMTPNNTGVAYAILAYTINGGSEFVIGYGNGTATAVTGSSGCVIAQLALNDVIRLRGATESAAQDINLRRWYMYRLPGQ